MIILIFYYAATLIMGCEAFVTSRYEVGAASSSSRLSSTESSTTPAIPRQPEYLGGFDTGRMDALTERGILEANLMATLGVLEEANAHKSTDDNKKKKKIDKIKKNKGPSTAISVRTLNQEGVIRLNGILSASTAAKLRGEILNRRDNAYAAISSEGASEQDWRKYFADALLKRNRCDLLLPLNDDDGEPWSLQTALHEMLVSSNRLYNILQTATSGDDATLYELSALISEPGSPRQPVHPDNPHQKQCPLYTVFIALQDIASPKMGPTIFLPRTNTLETHAEYNNIPHRDAFLESSYSVAALLNAGDAVLFDSRTMHCGGANDEVEGATRVLLCLSFRNPRATEPIGNVGSIMPGIEKITLRNLRSKLVSSVKMEKEEEKEEGTTGGFGSGGNTKGKENKSPKERKILNDLFTPQGRMDHIKAQIEAADISLVAKLILTKGGEDGQSLALDIDPNAIAVVDNFLGKELITAMRAEAESLLPTLVPSQSTRWDEATQTVIPYEKKGVLSTQIEGGLDYDKSPRLVEYIVTLTSHLSHRLNQILPDAYHLAQDEQTNKLAVCLGDGSYYDKHIDNLGGGSVASIDTGDRRKLTALLYIQPPGSHDGHPSYPNESADDDPRGGYFRAYDVPNKDETTCIAPRGDRLILFWSDSLVHDVSPSFAPHGDVDRRWALTVWFIADKKSGIIRATDAAIEERHFGSTAQVGKG